MGSSSTATTTFPKNGTINDSDIIVSYGKYTDQHLFAKFGFVPKDGSGYTECGINVMHRILGDIGLGKQFSYLPFEGSDNDDDDEIQRRKKRQRQDLRRYMIYDDGHDECIRSLKTTTTNTNTNNNNNGGDDTNDDDEKKKTTKRKKKIAKL